MAASAFCRWVVCDPLFLRLRTARWPASTTKSYILAVVDNLFTEIPNELSPSLPIAPLLPPSLPSHAHALPLPPARYDVDDVSL